MGLAVFDGVPGTIERMKAKPDDFNVSFSVRAFA